MGGLEAMGGLGVALALGMKHGLDADHLAAIDGLSRLHAALGRPRLARRCGLLFAGGHGAVVLTAAWMLQGHAAALPAWLDHAGSWISIGLLAVLGVVNLRQALAPDGAAPGGLIAPWLMRLPVASRPWGAAVVGALFAISFDTLAIAGWFGVTAAAHGGAAVLLTASVFVLGMAASDGANGWFVARMLQRSRSTHRRSARAFQVAVAGLALVVAAFGTMRALSPPFDAWAEGRAAWLGLGLVAAVALGFAWTMREAAASRSDSTGAGWVAPG